MKKELIDLKQYILGADSEAATSHNVYPFFQKLFIKDKFKRESAANGADIYITGRLVVELKTKEEDWLSGFFQALHYLKKGLSFSAVCVIAHNFIGLWRIDQLPSIVIDLMTRADANKPASEIGKTNANKTNRGDKNEILDSSLFLWTKDKALYLDTMLLEFEDRLLNLDSLRHQINPDNFLRKIGFLLNFFPDALQAIHCFYSMLPFWDNTSVIPNPPPSKQNVLWMHGKNGTSASDEFQIDPKHQSEFRDFVQSHYVFTNDEEGISIDYYFSRFDEALALHYPEYVKQHGIFFTDINLSRFALWFIREILILSPHFPV